MPYIQYFPQPFLDDLVKGIVFPFVGSGLSFNAIPPLPTFDQIGRELAAQIPDYRYRENDPVDAISAFEQAYGRTKLIENLSAMLNKPGTLPGPAIEAFARLPFRLVATTNFDPLLEGAYRNIGRPVYDVVEEYQLPLYPYLNEDSVTLLKVHGDFNYPDRIIVTENDYDTFVTRYPLYAAYLASRLTVLTTFFIGYSLNDYDFRFILRFVDENLGRFPRLPYALQINASQESILRFNRRGVRVINIPGDITNARQILTDVFTELLDYWLEHLIEESIATDPDVAAQLARPSEAKGQLCLLAIPHERLAAFHSKLSPTLRAMGFIPVAVNDLYVRGGQEVAKTQALAKKAALIILDRKSPLVGYYSKSFAGKKILLTTSDDPKLTTKVQRMALEIHPQN